MKHPIEEQKSCQSGTVIVEPRHQTQRLCIKQRTSVASPGSLGVGAQGFGRNHPIVELRSHISLLTLDDTC